MFLTFKIGLKSLLPSMAVLWPEIPKGYSHRSAGDQKRPVAAEKPRWKWTQRLGACHAAAPFRNIRKWQWTHARSGAWASGNYICTECASDTLPIKLTLNSPITAWLLQQKLRISQACHIRYIFKTAIPRNCFSRLIYLQRPRVCPSIAWIHGSRAMAQRTKYLLIKTSLGQLGQLCCWNKYEWMKPEEMVQ